MSLADIFLISIYLHFNKMKETGRQVVPWFSTCSAISFFAAISGALALKLLLGEKYNGEISQSAALIGFVTLGCLCFFIVKSYFFNSGRHLDLSVKYLEDYSSQKRLLYKILSIGFILLVPICFGFIIWLNAKP